MTENFGLVYESTFDGSMYGTSPVVFAVWMYVIAHGYGGQVDLHPKKLADTLGTTVADVEAAIRFHCSPDPDSRSDADDGRRLRHLGGVRYEVVNHDLYKSARALEEKRAYDRQKKRESRERRSTADVPIFDLSKRTTTTTDPLVLVSVSSPSGSDPEGVQGEPELHTKLGDWVIPPELYDEAEREHCIGRDELDERVSAIRLRPLPGRGVLDRTGYVRGLLALWATWEEPKPKGARKSRPPKHKPPPVPPPAWVDETHLLFANEHGLKLSEVARELKRRGIPPDVEDARQAFTRLLAEQAAAQRRPSAAA